MKALVMSIGNLVNDYPVHVDVPEIKSSTVIVTLQTNNQGTVSKCLVDTPDYVNKPSPCWRINASAVVRHVLTDYI